MTLKIYLHLHDLLRYIYTRMFALLVLYPHRRFALLLL